MRPFFLHITRPAEMAGSASCGSRSTSQISFVDKQDDWSYYFAMPKPSKVEENKTRLLEAGIALFSQRGYHGIGLKELLAQVKVPKGSFYNYFESKEDFAIQAITFYGDLLIDLLAVAARRDDRTALARFESVFDFLIKIYEEKNYTDGCLVGDMATEVGDVSDLCRRTLDKTMDKFARSFQEFTDQGQADGSMRTDIAPEDLAAFCLDAWEGALIRMRLKKDKAPLLQSKRLILQYLAG